LDLTNGYYQIRSSSRVTHLPQFGSNTAK